MSRPDKAVEPSMEEILASIRKIISEEPIGTRPGPSDGQAPTGALGRYEPGADPSLTSSSLPLSAGKPQVSAETVGLDEMLHLAQGTAPGQANGTAGDTGWMAKSVGTEPQPATPAPKDACTGATPVAADRGAPENDKSAYSAPKREVNGHATEPGGGAAARPLNGAAKSEASKVVQPSAQADSALNEARAKIERHLGSPPRATSADKPPVPGLKSIRDLEFQGVKPRSEPEVAGKPGAGGLMARVAAASSNGTNSPASPASGSREPAPKAADNITAPKEDTAKPRAADLAVNAPVVEKGPAAASPHEARPAQIASAASGKTAAPGGDRARALEDAVAEMLRPMLREWLDANLPRLVQQALREEMAKSTLPGKDNPAG